MSGQLVVYTLSEVAEQLRVSKPWLRNFIKQHPIPYKRAGTKALFDERAIKITAAYLPGPLQTPHSLYEELACIDLIDELSKEPMDPYDGGKRTSPGYVYFIQCGPRVKIGFTTNVEARLQALQTGSSEQLSILHYEEGGERDERRMHKAFRQYKVAREWFRLTGELSRFIEMRMAR